MTGFRSVSRAHQNRSTIFRELKRNTFVDKLIPDLNGYYCVTAHDMACERCAKLRKLSRFSHVRQSVVDRIIHSWSHADGTSSDLGQPRNDLQVRLFGGRIGYQAMAASAGVSCQA
jgi:IS30 family transposase